MVEKRSDKEWYLPHHPILNPNKPGKVSRVLMGAAKVHSSSMNKSLLTGPDLLQNLMHVLFRLEQHPYAVSADIEGVCLQVGVFQSDQPSHRFLTLQWINNRAIFSGLKTRLPVPTMHYNALRETMPSFTPKLQEPSSKTSTWTISLTQWSLLRRPSIDRRNWYIFSISVGSSLQSL